MKLINKHHKNNMKFTCDRILGTYNDEYFRAIDIKAPPSVVFNEIIKKGIEIDNENQQCNIKIGDKMLSIFRIQNFIPNEEITIELKKPPLRYEEAYVPTAITYKIVPFKTGDEIHSKLFIKYVANWRRNIMMQIEKTVVTFVNQFMFYKQLINFKSSAERDFRLSYIPN